MISSPKDRVRVMLSAVLLERFGLDLDELDRSASFAELGFDSFLLTQLCQAIRTQFEIDLSFRQLIEMFPNPDTLLEHLVETLPAPADLEDAIHSEPSSGLDVSGMTLSFAENTMEDLRKLMTHQLQIMSQQLALLNAAPNASHPASSGPDTANAARKSGPKNAANSKAHPLHSLALLGSPESGLFATSSLDRQHFGDYLPLEKNPDGGLTAMQQIYLDAFIDRYTKRTAGSKSRAGQCRPYLADPRAVSGFRRLWKEIVYPITAVRSKGSKLLDIDGNEFVDLALGYGTNLFGHSPDFITREIAKQLKRGIEFGPQHPLARDVASLLCELAQQDRAAFFNSGSEAVMIALRLARLYSGNSRFVVFQGARHGNFDEVLVRVHSVQGRQTTRPSAPGIPEAIARHAMVLEFGAPAGIEAIQDQAPELAAVLVDPTLRPGFERESRAFLLRLRAMTHELDIPLILDESTSGFRLAPGGAQAWFEFNADLVVYSKILGGGMPFGAIAGKARYLDGLDSGAWQFGDDSLPESDVTSYTSPFAGHPLALAAARAVLLRVKAEGPELQNVLTARTAGLVDDLNAFFEERRVPLRLLQLSSMFRLVHAPDLQFINLVYYHLLNKGIFTAGLDGHQFLSTAHSAEDIEHIRRAYKEAIIEMQNGGLLPGYPKRSHAADAVMSRNRVEREEAETAKQFDLQTVPNGNTEAEVETASAEMPEEKVDLKRVEALDKESEAEEDNEIRVEVGSVSDADRAADTESGIDQGSTSEVDLESEIEFEVDAEIEIELDEDFATMDEPLASDSLALPLQEEEPLEIELVAEKPSETPFLLTESQTKIWVASRLSPEASSAFNEPFLIRLSGSMHVEFMREAIRSAIGRHEAFGLRFSEDGTAQHRHMDAPALEIPFTDLTELSASERESRFEEAQEDFATHRFDLTNGPLVRVSIFKLADNAHSLLFSAHHIICDGWSWSIVLSDVSTLYNAACRGETARLSEPGRFSGYVRHEIERQDSDELAAVYQYWVDRFAEQPPLLDLPTDRPRPAFKSFEGATVRYQFDAEVYKMAKRVAAEQHVSLFTLLLATFNVLLARLSGQNDIVVAIPSAGQLQFGNDNLVGHCVRLLPLRSTIDRKEPIAGFLKRTTVAVLEAYDHQACTLDGILRRLKIPRDPARLPLVEVSFNLDRAIGGPDFQDLETVVTQCPKHAVNFDLFFNLDEMEEGLFIDLDYNAHLFDKKTMRRWIRQFEALLQGIAQNANRPVAQLPLTRESQSVFRSAVINTASFKSHTTVHELFEKQAAATPDATALTFEDTSLEFRELDEYANQFAQYLITLKVVPDMLVGVAMERSAGMLVALLGILKAGGAYLAMDPADTEDRLTREAVDAGLRILLTENSILDTLDRSSLPESLTVIPLDAEWSKIARRPKSRPKNRTSSDNLAIVASVSRTDEPADLVPFTHRSLVNLLTALHQQPGLSEEDVMLSAASLSSGLATLELLLPLISGAQVVIVPKDTAENGHRLARAIDTHLATAFHNTASGWRNLLATGWEGHADLTMFSGGEPLDLPFARELLAKGRVLWYFYGHPETTLYSSVQRIDAGASAQSIGKPLGNTQFYILDDNLNLVPPGTPGLLYIGGEGLSNGYLFSAQQTEARFIPNPFEKETGSMLFRTEDQVRIMPDGTFEFLPRPTSDPIEMPEPAPEEAGSLAASLEPVIDHEVAFEPPRTPIERAISSVWTDVLALERIGIHDNFFDLGGHSLQATRVMSQLREPLQMEVPLQLLFEKPTIAELALAITQLQVSQENDADILQMIEELGGLSDEEVARLLKDDE